MPWFEPTTAADRDRFQEATSRNPVRLAQAVNKAREALEAAQAQQVIAEAKTKAAYAVYRAARKLLNAAQETT